MVIGAELGVRYGVKESDGKQPMAYRSTMGKPLDFIGATARGKPSNAASVATVSFPQGSLRWASRMPPA